MVAYPGRAPRAVPLDPRYAETILGPTQGASGEIQATRGLLDLFVPKRTIVASSLAKVKVPGYQKTLSELSLAELDEVTKRAAKEWASDPRKAAWVTAIEQEILRRMPKP